mmetsp:Transcript_33168/g.75730  ORF Transcript_33168/g.75730 Transcript_33168/m.75730 type:complete len:205 (-) Transcript_33168:839-1453(-)
MRIPSALQVPEQDARQERHSSVDRHAKQEDDGVLQKARERPAHQLERGARARVGEPVYPLERAVVDVRALSHEHREAAASGQVPSTVSLVAYFLGHLPLSKSLIGTRPHFGYLVFRQLVRQVVILGLALAADLRSAGQGLYEMICRVVLCRHWPPTCGEVRVHVFSLPLVHQTTLREEHHVVDQLPDLSGRLVDRYDHPTPAPS